MWSLTISNPKSEPVQIKLTPGKMLIGRLVNSDIVINDIDASRRHAEIYYDPVSDVAFINDLNSSNGTYVNRQKIKQFYRLQNGDVIRIGLTVMYLAKIANAAVDPKGYTGTHLFTRELVLEAIDEHPILLNEVIEKLNEVVEINGVIRVVSELLKRALGVDICEVVLAEDFKNIIKNTGTDNMRVRTIQNSSIEESLLALCIPVMVGGKPLALFYLEKTRQGAIPFEKRDMQLAVAISHQTALALQRIELLEKVHTEGEVKQLLLRFVSPIEAEDILKDYLKTGKFPDLARKKVTVLFAEISDLTGLAERMDPKEFPTFLSNFYQYSTQAVFKNGGMIKFLGDGILAVFMDKKGDLGPEDRAVIVGREIIEYVMSADLPDQARPFEIGVAINTGNALVGYVGTQARAEFNVMGRLIKMTYRMQEYALPNRMFVGSSTADAIRNKYMIKRAGSLSMKGSDQPIQVFEVSLAKISPFVQIENEMSAAFREISEKLKTHRKMGADD
jgi:class 3 adenylate cyclase